MGDLTKEAFKNLNNSIEFNQSAQFENKELNKKYEELIKENTILSKDNLNYQKEIKQCKDQLNK